MEIEILFQKLSFSIITIAIMKILSNIYEILGK